MALGIKLADLTGGFRIYSRQLLESLNLTQMNATGYCFQIEMALAAHLAQAQATQVPITFVERINGVSKMSRSIVIEALIQTTRWGINRRLKPNSFQRDYAK
jgi:dolichol-phosphate mannosyltransferase